MKPSTDLGEQAELSFELWTLVAFAFLSNRLGEVI